MKALIIPERITWLIFYLLQLSVMQTCQSADLTYYVEEGKSPGTYLGDIAADIHLVDIVQPEEYHLVSFSQLKQDMMGSSQLFHVSEKTGKLYTAQTLDAEFICEQDKECVKMMDVAVQKASSFIKLIEIKVIVKDVNDHQPEFPYKQIDLQFLESDRIGLRKPIPNAVDGDVGISNSLVTYELNKNANEPFKLSAVTCIDGTSELGIELEELLDREKKESYKLQVIATDSGFPPKNNILYIYVSVADVNDNFPVLTQELLNVSVINQPSELSPIATLFAKDADMGENGQVSYHFSSKTSGVVKSHFHLNVMTGEIFLRRKFIWGQDLLHKLYVKASDGGTFPLSSFAMVLVNVINIQNHPPSVALNFFSASAGRKINISEDAAIGSFVAYVKVTDHDAAENGEVSCDLYDDKFKLESLGDKKFKVVVKKPLDREVADHHDIIISCQDKGSPPLYTERRFYVKVKDVNDVPPQFPTQMFKFWIYENQKSNFPVGSIKATDPDLGPGGKLTYSLISDSKQFLPFQISNNRVISTINSLDHELQNVYRFQVLARDNGIPSLNNTVNVTVEVRDENDNDPYFTFPGINPYMMDVEYQIHHTKNISILKASDSDSEENAFITFELLTGDTKDLFIINNYTGLLSFSREAKPEDAGTYELEFVAKDNGTPVLSATTTVILTLTVSNKTAEMLNSVQIQSSNFLHTNLLITIILITVTVILVIAACISIFVIQFNNQQNTPHGDKVNPSTRCMGEIRHLLCPSYHASPWADVSVTAAVKEDTIKNPAVVEKDDQLDEEMNNKRTVSSVTTKEAASLDILDQSQASVLEVSNKETNNEKETPEPNLSWRYPTTYPSEESPEWKEPERKASQDLSDIYKPKYLFRATSQVDQLENIYRKPLQQAYNYFSDIAIAAKCFCQPAFTQNFTTRRWNVPKSATVDNSTSGSQRNSRYQT